MSIAKMVREMIERGVDIDVIELAVATAEAALADRASADVRVTERDEQAERRRERDRERQQRYRDNLRIKRDNPQTSADVTNASLSNQEKKEDRKEERGERKRDVTRGHRLPDDWQPSPQDQATADELIGADRVASELEKFRDHWKQQPGSKGVKLDWSAAWRNWIRRAAEYGGNRNGHRTGNVHPHPATQQSGSTAVLAGVAAAAERRARERSAAGQQRTTSGDVGPAEGSDPDIFGANGSAAAHR